jgi:hypothetical protein
MTSPDDARPDAREARRGERRGRGIAAVTFAYLMVVGFSTSPSPLHGLYKARDGFSSFTITLIYAATPSG